jgi:hypothetical protein
MNINQRNDEKLDLEHIVYSAIGTRKYTKDNTAVIPVILPNGQSGTGQSGSFREFQQQIASQLTTTHTT